METMAMRENKRTKDIKKIRRIRELQKFQARIDLAQSNNRKAENIARRNEVFEGSLAARATWEACFVSNQMIPEHIQYWSGKVNWHEDLCRQADQAVDLASIKNESDANVFMSAYIQTLQAQKFQMKISRFYQRKLKVLEEYRQDERTARAWWRAL
jgi:hypothetical protein